jgi:hypothetical protein
MFFCKTGKKVQFFQIIPSVIYSFTGSALRIEKEPNFSLDFLSKFDK